MTNQLQGNIGFKKLAISCTIGVFPEERSAAQTIFVDLAVTIDFLKCVHHDAFEEAVDYVMLSRLTTEIAQRGQFLLIETCAYTILKKVTQLNGVISATIKIEKPLAIPNSKGAFVELTMEGTWTGL